MIKNMIQSVSIIGAILAITTVVGFAQGSNVVVNSDFLGGGTNWTTTVSGSGSSVTFVANDQPGTPFIGTTALLRAASDSHFVTLKQSGITLTAGATYRLALGCATNRTSGMAFELEISDGINSIFYDIPLGGTREFVQDFIVPAGFGTASMTFTVANTSGTVLSRTATVDNISLTKLQ